MSETMTTTASTGKTVLTFRIPGDIRKELGDISNDIDCIKVVSFSDRINTRGVYICTSNNEVLEEVSPTPLHSCGLVTILNGKFVLIQSNDETTLHFVNAKSEDDVIDEVHMLSERSGLANGIVTYKSMGKQIQAICTEML